MSKERQKGRRREATTAHLVPPLDSLRSSYCLPHITNNPSARRFAPHPPRPSFFGMNLNNKIENDDGAFQAVVWGTLGGAAVLGILMVWKMSNAGVF